MNCAANGEGNFQAIATRKGFVALTFVDQSNTSSEFVDINNLLVVLAYEDDAHRSERRVLRLSGYEVGRVSDGVCFGGAENCRMYKISRSRRSMVPVARGSIAVNTNCLHWRSSLTAASAEQRDIRRRRGGVCDCLGYGPDSVLATPACCKEMVQSSSRRVADRAGRRTGYSGNRHVRFMA